MREMIYYLRDKQKRPIVTVVVLEKNRGEFYRGVSICSPNDNPMKRRGYGIAKGRALKAMKGNIGGDDEIRRYEPVTELQFFVEAPDEVKINLLAYGKVSRLGWSTLNSHEARYFDTEERKEKL